MTTHAHTAFSSPSLHDALPITNDSPANSLAFVKVTSLPLAGTLKNDGTAVTLNQEVSAADIAAGKLKVEKGTNAYATHYGSFNFKVRVNGGTDNGGVDLSASANTITVNVRSVNDAPSAADKSETTNEHTAYTFASTILRLTRATLFPYTTLFRSVKVTSLPLAGTLKNDGTAVTLNQEVSAADIAAGKL